MNLRRPSPRSWRPRLRRQGDRALPDAFTSEMAAVAAAVVAEQAGASARLAPVLSGPLEAAQLDPRTGRLELCVAGHVETVVAWDRVGAEALVAMAALEAVHLRSAEQDGWLVVVASSPSWSYAVRTLPAP